MDDAERASLRAHIDAALALEELAGREGMLLLARVADLLREPAWDENATAEATALWPRLTRLAVTESERLVALKDEPMLTRELVQLPAAVATALMSAAALIVDRLGSDGAR